MTNPVRHQTTKMEVNFESALRGVASIRWCKAIGIAVGTVLTDGPPHRSQRAGLPHWAPALGGGGETHFGVGMQDPGGR